MASVKKFFTSLWRDESAQGATEYILLLVAVVAVVMLFKEQIFGMLKAKMDDLGSSIGGITTKN